MALRESNTSTIELGTTWEGDYATEPHECAWAREARYFIRVLKGDVPKGALVRVQVSPDGIHWCDEGTRITLPLVPGITSSERVEQFGGWMRLVGSLPAGDSIQVIVHLVLKG